MIRLPENSSREAGELGARLLIVTPGEKLVYATDLADTAANRAALIALAHKSDIFFLRGFVSGNQYRAGPKDRPSDGAGLR